MAEWWPEHGEGWHRPRVARGDRSARRRWGRDARPDHRWPIPARGHARTRWDGTRVSRDALEAAAAGGGEAVASVADRVDGCPESVRTRGLCERQDRPSELRRCLRQRAARGWLVVPRDGVARGEA